MVGEQGLEVAVWRWAVLGNSGVQGVSWEEGSSGDGDTPLSLLCVFSLLYMDSSHGVGAHPDLV